MASYQEQNTFSPTVHHATLRLLLAYAVKHSCTISTVDIGGAYLYAHVEAGKDIYLRLPSCLKELDVNFDDPATGKPATYIRLRRYLYGLQAAGREFYTHFVTWIVSLGFRQCAADPCLFVFRRGQEMMAVAIYVDDDLIVSSSGRLSRWYARAFAAKFQESPDSIGEGKVHEFLGMRIEHDTTAGTLTLSAPRLLDKLTAAVGSPPLPVPSPLVPDHVKRLEEEPSDANPVVPESSFSCRAVLGSVLWMVLACRPDACHAASLLARHVAKQTKHVVDGVRRLAHYLISTRDYALTFRKNGCGFRAYVDSSFANDPSRKSWYCFLLYYAGAPFAYRSKLSSCVAPSTRDAEIIAAVHCLKHVLGFQILMDELGERRDGATDIHIDNAACTDGVANDRIRADSRWQAIRLAFVREKVKMRLVRLLHISGVDNPADIGTKVLGPADFDRHAKVTLGLRGVPASSRRKVL